MIQNTTPPSPLRDDPTPSIAAYGLQVGPRIPLSFAQYRIWYLQQLYGDNVMYNVARCFKVDGSLDPDTVRKALHVLHARQEPLRSRLYLGENGMPFQRIGEEPCVDFRSTDLGRHPPHQAAAEADRAVRETVLKPFDLGDDTPLRTRCLRLGPSEWILLFVQHHIATDYSSWQIFLHEFSTVYTSILEGSPPALPRLPLRYSEFARRQWERTSADHLRNAHAYWRGFFHRDVRRESDPGLAGGVAWLPDSASYGVQRQLFPPSVVRDCKAFAAGNDCTLFTVILSAISLLVNTLYGDPEVSVCFASGNRREPEVRPLMGCFFTNIILRLAMKPDYSPAALIRNVRDQFSSAKESQRVPFEMFADDLGLEATRQRRPPYRVYISYRHSAGDADFTLPGARLFPMPASTGRNTREDIVFNFWERGSPDGGLSLELEWLWRTDRFDSRAIVAAASTLESLLHRFSTA